MPKLWRYLFYKYIQIFSLSIFSFIAILFVSRFKDVARFAAITADWGKTAQFMAYLIPTILPMATPISALICALFLSQQLDRNHELTALRSSGISLKAIFTPLFILSLFLSILHFSLCAEIAPYCRRESRALLYRETSANPLLLLQRQRLVKIPNLYLKMKVKEEGKLAYHLQLVGFNEQEKRLSMILARKIRLAQDKLIGEDIAFITPCSLKNEEGFLIENQAALSMHAPLLTKAIKKNRPSLDASTLNLKMLRLRSKEWGNSAKSARVEIIRRLTLSLSLLSFTLLGFAFGIEVSRLSSKRGLLKTVALGLTFLICYLLGKGFKHEFYLSALVYLIPHPLIWFFSCAHLQKIGKGAS